MGQFAYTKFFGNLLGSGIRIKNCGPWAGNINSCLKNSSATFQRTTFRINRNLVVITVATDGIGKSFGLTVN